MKGIDIIEAMEGIDEKLLLDAKNHRRAIPGWLRWTSMAACLCCALLVGVLSMSWIMDDSALPEPLPEALAEPEQSTWGSESMMGESVTLSSSNYPVSITVPGEYAEHVLVDTPYYYDTGGEGSIENNDVIFSFFVDYKEEDQLSGLVWFILATDPIPNSDDYYAGPSGPAYMFSSSILGSDENHTYLLCHPGIPKDHCFDGNSYESTETYLTFAQDSIDILRAFIYDNDLTSDWGWKERFAEFTITPTENALAFLTGLGYYTSPTVTFSSEDYPVTLTVPEQYAEDIHVDTPFSSSVFDETIAYDNVVFSFHYNYSAEATDAGLVFVITATPDTEFDYNSYERHKDEGYMFSSSVIGEDSEYVYEIIYPGAATHPFVDSSNILELETYLDHLYAALAILDNFAQENDLAFHADWYDYFTERPIASTRERLKQLENISPMPTADPAPTVEPEPTPTPTVEQEPTPTPAAEAGVAPEELVISLSRVNKQASLDENQFNNQLLACEAINGTILEPGDSFSFNDIVGIRSAEKGYLVAPVYSINSSDTALGGGISLVSSYLYECCLLADLEIMARQSLTFRDPGIDPGLDAAVYWGSVDFQFTNSSDAPILIRAEFLGEQIRIEFLTSAEKTFYAKLSHELVDVTPFTTVTYEGPGENITGMDGCTCLLTREIYDLEDNLIRTDTPEDLNNMLGIGTTTYALRDEVIYTEALP